MRQFFMKFQLLCWAVMLLGIFSVVYWVISPFNYRWDLTREKVDSLRAALDRVAAGTYGICRRCGKRIDRARLEIVPDANLCIECARQGGE